MTTPWITRSGRHTSGPKTPIRKHRCEAHQRGGPWYPCTGQLALGWACTPSDNARGDVRERKKAARSSVIESRYPARRTGMGLTKQDGPQRLRYAHFRCTPRSTREAPPQYAGHPPHAQGGLLGWFLPPRRNGYAPHRQTQPPHFALQHAPDWERHLPPERGYRYTQSVHGGASSKCTWH